MKKGILIAVIALFTGLANLKAQDQFDVQMKCYKNALKNYDLQSATVAVYNMIALKPERTDLNDTLALLYFNGERYGQAFLVGEQILQANPKRMDILGLVAVSKQNLGMVKEALADYEQLYASEKSLYYLYQMATLQYQLKRYGECVASLDVIISDDKSAQQKVNIQVQGGSQEVSMKAAAYNVKGICALEMNQDEIAKANFTEALKLDPNFVLAKGNVEMIEKKEQQSKAPATNTKAPATTGKTATAPK